MAEAAAPSVAISDETLFQEGFYKESFGEKSMLDMWKSYPESSRATIEWTSYPDLSEMLWYTNENQNSSILALNIKYIDRGVVGDELATLFPEMLKASYPNLECLTFKQNYCGSSKNDKQTDFEGFLKHPFIRQLAHLSVADCQSHWDISPDIIKLSLPEETKHKKITRMFACNYEWEPKNYVEQKDWKWCDENGKEGGDEIQLVEPESNWDGISAEERKRLSERAPVMEGRAPSPGVEYTRMVTVTMTRS